LPRSGRTLIEIAAVAIAQELPEEIIPIVAELKRSKDRKNLFVYFSGRVA